MTKVVLWRGTVVEKVVMLVILALLNIFNIGVIVGMMIITALISKSFAYAKK